MAALDTEHTTLAFECNAARDTHWTVRAASLRERLNEPYSLLLRLDTEDLSAEPAQMLGQQASLTVIRGPIMRRIAGIVSEVQEGSTHPEMVSTNLVIVPALEALRHGANTRIFQSMTVPEILDEVLGEGLAPYLREVDLRLSRRYPTCDFRVQYDESDLEFCERLMEEEGIVYWFEVDGDAETLVLTDSAEELGEIEGLHGSVIEFTLDDSGVGGHEYVSAFERRSSIRPTEIVARHFDWTAPSVPIEGGSSETAGEGDIPHGASVGPAREVYEHDEDKLTTEPGGTTTGGDSADQMRIRREQQAWDARVCEGTSTVVAMRVGALFELVLHPRIDLDGRYLPVGVTHHFDEGGASYRNEIECIPEGTPFRPPRETPRPRIESILTATVVGPPGEEIHTDEHGRVKVQFHWDRHGSNDERSSAWVRVMQPWAGAGWGFVFIPRIGMEVLVSFVDGDPDRPLVTGALYNGDHPPPYPLPDEKTKSTIKTETSLGGGGYNEWRFEDKAGAEEIFTHAQKDQNEVVENDHTTTVHHDHTNGVDHDQIQDVGNDQIEHVMNNQSLEVGADRTIQVHGNFEETIDGSETRTVSSGVTETIDGGETRTINGDMSEEINGPRTQSINGSTSEDISGSLSQQILGGATITTPATYKISAAAGVKLTTPASMTIIAPAGHQLIAPGGQSTIDNFKFWLGGNYLNNFAINMSMTSVKMEFTGVNTGMINLHIDSSNMKVAAGGVFLKTLTNEIKCAGPITKKNLVELRNEAAKIIT